LTQGPNMPNPRTNTNAECLCCQIYGAQLCVHMRAIVTASCAVSDRESRYPRYEYILAHTGPRELDGHPHGGVWFGPMGVWSGLSSRLYYPFGKGPGQHIIRCLKNQKVFERTKGSSQFESDDEESRPRTRVAREARQNCGRPSCHS